MSDGMSGLAMMTDHDLLVRIATQNEAILERLNKGDTVMEDHDERLDEHDTQIVALQHRVRDLDGGEGWPSWVEIQKFYLGLKTLFWAAVKLCGVVAGMTALVFAWLGFSHPK